MVHQQQGISRHQSNGARRALILMDSERNLRVLHISSDQEELGKQSGNLGGGRFDSMMIGTSMVKVIDTTIISLIPVTTCLAHIQARY